MELEVYKKSDFYEDYISSQKEYYERENADAYFAERIAEKDKEIADLEDKLRAANEQIENLINSASRIMLFQDRVNDNKCDELRHANYKRCLAMALWCDLKESYLYAKALRSYKKKETDYLEKKSELYNKWRKRWLELAEKFKPNNSTAQ